MSRPTPRPEISLVVSFQAEGKQEQELHQFGRRHGGGHVVAGHLAAHDAGADPFQVDPAAVVAQFDAQHAQPGGAPRA
ncbi:hypothetical protein LP420_07440 [Massilia sp. B-10]|nr:hypothetical protein LP420_07440 [Massilia sp. B-10]